MYELALHPSPALRAARATTTLILLVVLAALPATCDRAAAQPCATAGTAAANPAN